MTRLSPGSRALTAAEWRAGLGVAVAPLLERGLRVALILDTPFPEFNMSTCLAHAPAANPRRCALPRRAALNFVARAALSAEARALGVAVVDPAPWFCTGARPDPRSPGGDGAAGWRGGAEYGGGEAAADGGSPREAADGGPWSGGAASGDVAESGPWGQGDELDGWEKTWPDGPRAGDVQGGPHGGLRGGEWEEGVCPAVVGGVAVYRDAAHATTRYTRLLARRLADALPWDL